MRIFQSSSTTEMLPDELPSSHRRKNCSPTWRHVNQRGLCLAGPASELEVVHFWKKIGFSEVGRAPPSGRRRVIIHFAPRGIFLPRAVSGRSRCTCRGRRRERANFRRRRRAAPSRRGNMTGRRADHARCAGSLARMSGTPARMAVPHQIDWQHAQIRPTERVQQEATVDSKSSASVCGDVTKKTKKPAAVGTVFGWDNQRAKFRAIRALMPEDRFFGDLGAAKNAVEMAVAVGKNGGKMNK